MEYIYFSVLLCVGSTCIFFTTYGCYHYIRNRFNQDNNIDVMREVLNPNNNKKVHFDC